MVPAHVSDVVRKIYGALVIESRPRILYLSLNGMSEPLGRSQVLEYLFEIGTLYDVTILSCEKPDLLRHEPGLEKEIAGRNIGWKHIYYSNRFGLVSALVLFVRFAGAAIVLSVLKKPRILHARSLIPAGVAIVVKSILRQKVVFDIRGFFVDEKVDSSGLKKNSLLFRVLKSFERRVYRGSDHIITLTRRAKDIVSREYGIAQNLITVIPTCANTRLFKHVSGEDKAALRRKLGLPNGTIIIHHGQVQGWYDFESEVRLFKAVHDRDGEVVFLLLNRGQQEYIETVFHQFNIPQEAYLIRRVDFSEVYLYLNVCDISLFFIPPTYSKQASHPTKFAENAACRLFSVTNSGIGDMDFYADTYKTAFLIDLAKLPSSIDKAAADVLAILKDATLRAQEHDYERLMRECLSNDVAVERYLTIYKQLIS